MAVWYFVRVAPGDLRPLREEEMEAFLRAQIALPADEDGLVHYIGLEVAEQESAILDLGRVWFARCRTLDDGRLDQRAMLDQVNERLSVQKRAEAWRPDSDVVVDASALFEARRAHFAARWDPTDADLHRLRALVNERAGWSIL